LVTKHEGRDEKKIKLKIKIVNRIPLLGGARGGFNLPRRPQRIKKSRKFVGARIVVVELVEMRLPASGVASPYNYYFSIREHPLHLRYPCSKNDAKNIV
jgi:hypothetical protein